jgi:opacity protein-like surface antigen
MSHRIILTAILVAAVLAPAAATADTRDGAYVFISGQYLDFQRDFRHNLTLWHFEKAFFVPRLNRGAAVAIGYGRKSPGRSWDVSYLYAPRTVTLADGEHSAAFHALEINGRSYFFKKASVHPYFQGGIAIPFVHVKNGSLYLGKKLNASYFGAGLNVGTGVMIEISPSLFLNIGAQYRVVGFLYAYGEGKGRDVNDLRIGYNGPKLGRMLRTDIVTLAVSLGFVL